MARQMTPTKCTPTGRVFWAADVERYGCPDCYPTTDENADREGEHTFEFLHEGANVNTLAEAFAQEARLREQYRRQPHLLGRIAVVAEYDEDGVLTTGVDERIDVWSTDAEGRMFVLVNDSLGIREREETEVEPCRAKGCVLWRDHEPPEHAIE